MRFSTVLSGIKAGILVPLLCLATAFAVAQSERPVSINVGGGFSPVVGNVSNDLNNGWHITAGAKYNVTSTFSIGPQFLYNGFGVPGSVLRRAGAPNGDAHVWAITADPRLQLPFSRLRPYLVGGVGYYRRTVNFTQPAVTSVTFFDPFFGYVFPGLVGTNQVLKTITRNGIGGSLGAGFGVKLGHMGTEFFTEARYHYADTGKIPTRMIPVTFGLRF